HFPSGMVHMSTGMWLGLHIHVVLRMGFGLHIIMVQSFFQLFLCQTIDVFRLVPIFIDFIVVVATSSVIRVTQFIFQFFFSQTINVLRLVSMRIDFVVVITSIFMGGSICTTCICCSWTKPQR